MTLLDYEGDYAFIEFTDRGTPSRGYVPDWMIDDEEDYDEDDRDADEGYDDGYDRDDAFDEDDE